MQNTKILSRCTGIQYLAWGCSYGMLYRGRMGARKYIDKSMVFSIPNG